MKVKAFVMFFWTRKASANSLKRASVWHADGGGDARTHGGGAVRLVV